MFATSPADVWLFHRTRYEPEWHQPMFQVVQHRPWRSAPGPGRSNPLFELFTDPVYPRDPPKNDVSLFRSAATDNLEKQRFCVVNHHDRGFERNNLMYQDENSSQNHHKTQHFIRGKMAGGSDKNSFVYGANMFPGRTERRTKQQNDGDGFLYGSSAVRRFEKKFPATRPNNQLMLEERMRETQYGKYKKLAAGDTDNYLARYYESKAHQQTEVANEKRKDLEMLRSYNPWGKPGGGAPRGYKTNAEVDAHLTNTMKTLKKEGQGRQGRQGAGGGGSPNRTTSGNVVTSLKMDPEIRFQAAQFNKDIDPRLRYKPDMAYGKELDALVQETTNRKKLERTENLAEEIRQMESYPFSHGGTTRHQRHVSEPKTISKESAYDPWGKGFGGIPERTENGKIAKNLQGSKQPAMEKPCLAYGMNDHNKSDENANSKRKGTLMKSSNGQAFVRDFSPKEVGYCPWGRPGAGAPLKDQHGRVVANTTGKLAHDYTEGSAQKKQDPVRKKEYLKSLEQQRHEQDVLREENDKFNRQDDLGVAAWVRQGRVGRPTYDPLTKQICANPKATSDITREKFQIRQMKNGNSRCYYDDLQEMAEDRHKRRQMERTKEQQLSLDHVATMNSFWGRPGGGAPVTRDPARRHAQELLPTSSVMFR